MAPNNYTRSIPEIFTDLMAQLTTLFRKESQLARAELSDKIGQVAGALALIIGGAVLLIPALVVLLEAAVGVLVEEGIAAPWSALIVGGCALAIGLILLMIGASRLKADQLVPSRTIFKLQRDATVAKQQMRHDNEQQRAA